MVFKRLDCLVPLLVANNVKVVMLMFVSKEYHKAFFQ